MTALDELADQHVDQLNIPAGSGVEAVVRDGRRRRRRRRRTQLSAATICVVAVGGLGINALRMDRSSEEILVQVDAPVATNPDEPSETTPTSGSNSIDVSVDTDSLPVRDNTELALVPTPVLEGWTIVPTAVAVVDRFSSDDGAMTVYSMRSGSSELTLDVSSGQADIAGETVAFDRDGETVDAALNRNGQGTWTLTWNERPGINTGIAVWMSGPDRTELIDTATAITFVDLPLVGAVQPNFVPTDPSLNPVFRGTTSDATWSVGQTGDGTIRIDIDGKSPAVTSSRGINGPEISVTTVSKDGVQITAIEVPADAQSVSIVTRDAEPIVLPISPLEGAERQLAVAPIPPQRDASVIAVLLEDGTQGTIGLPRAPKQGWTTWQLLSTQS